MKVIVSIVFGDQVVEKEFNIAKEYFCISEEEMETKELDIYDAMDVMEDISGMIDSSFILEE